MRLPNPKFKVLLFGPELPAEGRRALAHFEDGVLVVHRRGHWYTVPAQDLDLKTGGFDGRQWLVTWESPLGSYTAILQGDSSMHMFVDQAPEDLATRLHLARDKHRRIGNRFRAAMFAAVIVLFLPLFFLAWFWLNQDRFSEWAVDKISVQQEIQLGELAFGQMRARLDLLPEDALADEVVERIGVRVTAGSVYSYRFHVARDPSVNAYALPGGRVVVNTGLLLAADSADEVAGVLAHEASHVERRHALCNLIHGLGLRAVVAVALGDYAGGIWSDMAHHLSGLSYSRDQEREADLEALRLLRRVGLPAEGMAHFFERMAQQEGPRVDLLSSHPTSDERLRALRTAMAQGGGPICGSRWMWTGRRSKPPWMRNRRRVLDKAADMEITPEQLKQRSTLFAALDDTDIRATLELAHTEAHPAKHVVFREGEEGDRLLLLLEGRVKVSLSSPEGKEVILSILEPGQLIGEMSLLDGGQRSATVTTMDPCRFLAIWRKDFLGFLERRPHVALALLFPAGSCYVEVKSVTAAVAGGVGYFPDAVSERAARHMRELEQAVADGARAAVVFCVQRGDVAVVRPADLIDPAFATALRRAAAGGVELYALGAPLSGAGIRLERPLSVDLEWP